MPANTGTSSHFYPHHRSAYVCGKNSAGAPVFIGLPIFITKLYCMIWVKLELNVTILKDLNGLPALGGSGIAILRTGLSFPSRSI